MLDPWIIEEIQRREDKRRREREAIQIELPLCDERPEDDVPSKHSDAPKRGVAIMDM